MFKHCPFIVILKVNSPDKLNYMNSSNFTSRCLTTNTKSLKSSLSSLPFHQDFHLDTSLTDWKYDYILWVLDIHFNSIHKHFTIEHNYVHFPGVPLHLLKWLPIHASEDSWWTLCLHTTAKCCRQLQILRQFYCREVTDLPLAKWHILHKKAHICRLMMDNCYILSGLSIWSHSVPQVKQGGSLKLSCVNVFSSISGVSSAVFLCSDLPAWPADSSCFGSENSSTSCIVLDKME